MKTKQQSKSSFFSSIYSYFFCANEAIEPEPIPHAVIEQYVPFTEPPPTQPQQNNPAVILEQLSAEHEEKTKEYFDDMEAQMISHPPQNTPAVLVEPPHELPTPPTERLLTNSPVEPPASFEDWGKAVNVVDDVIPSPQEPTPNQPALVERQIQQKIDDFDAARLNEATPLNKLQDDLMTINGLINKETPNQEKLDEFHEKLKKNKEDETVQINLHQQKTDLQKEEDELKEQKAALQLQQNDLDLKIKNVEFKLESIQILLKKIKDDEENKDKPKTTPIEPFAAQQDQSQWNKNKWEAPPSMIITKTSASTTGESIWKDVWATNSNAIDTSIPNNSKKNHQLRPEPTIYHFNPKNKLLVDVLYNIIANQNDNTVDASLKITTIQDFLNSTQNNNNQQTF